MSASILHLTTLSCVSIRRAENVVTAWDTLLNASTKIYDSLSSELQPAFFELVHHPVLASSTLGKMWIAQGMNNLRSTQARLSTNNLADQVQDLFAQDYDIENQYDELLDGKWKQYVLLCLYAKSTLISLSSMMDQTHVQYFYWQQPMADVYVKSALYSYSEPHLS